MFATKVFEVLAICLPIFVLIALGWFLKRRRLLSDESSHFLNGLIFYLALPAVIFLEVSRQPFDKLMNKSLVFSCWTAVLLILAIYLSLGLLLGYRKGLAAAFSFGSYWANVTYLGFPLAASAFGPSEGLAYAAIVNAFAMPLFVFSGTSLMVLMVRNSTVSFWKGARSAILNPVVISAGIGILTALIIQEIKGDAEKIVLPMIAEKSMDAFIALLRLIGAMGLPLSLISIGASLNTKSLHLEKLPLALGIAGKLVITPLLTFLLLHYVFTGASKTAIGVAVLLMATPNAVGMVVISRQLKVEEEYISNHMVISTLLSVISLPIWLYFLI